MRMFKVESERHWPTLDSHRFTRLRSLVNIPCLDAPWGQPFLMYYIYQTIATHGRPPFYQQSRSTHQNHIGKPGNTPDAVSISQAGKETIRNRPWVQSLPSGLPLTPRLDITDAGCCEAWTTSGPARWDPRENLSKHAGDRSDELWDEHSEAIWSGTQWNSEFDPPDSFCKQFEQKCTQSVLKRRIDHSKKGLKSKSSWNMLEPLSRPMSPIPRPGLPQTLMKAMTSNTNTLQARAHGSTSLVKV